MRSSRIYLESFNLLSGTIEIMTLVQFSKIEDTAITRNCQLSIKIRSSESE